MIGRKTAVRKPFRLYVHTVGVNPMLLHYILNTVYFVYLFRVKKQRKNRAQPCNDRVQEEDGMVLDSRERKLSLERACLI